MAKLYSSDAQLLPPNKTPAQGTETIREFFAGLIDGGYRDHAIETIEVREVGDIGFQTGRWSALGPESDGGDVLFERTMEVMRRVVNMPPKPHHSLGTSGLICLVGRRLSEPSSIQPFLHPALNSSKETL